LLCIPYSARVKVKNDWFPKDWPENANEKIKIIWKHVDDINRAIYYKEDSRVIKNIDLFKKQNEVIEKESDALSKEISALSGLDLNGLGEFTNYVFGRRQTEIL
jgi:hypothetical protein